MTNNSTGPLIPPFNGKTPRIHESVWIAPNTTNIQDNCVLHVDADAPCTLGDDVTVGHMALVHGSTVGNGTLVGMKSGLLSRSVIGEGSLIAAGAIVLEGQDIPAKSLAAGVPAKVRRELSDEQSFAFIPHAGRYVETSKAQASISEALSLDEVRFG